MSKPREWVWYQVHWSRPITVDSVWDVLEEIASDNMASEIIFEVRRVRGETVFLLATTVGYAPEAKRMFESTIVGTILVELLANEVTKCRARLNTAKRVRLGHPALALRTDRATLISRHILAVMADVRDNEGVALQLMIGAQSLTPTDTPKEIPDPRTGELQMFMRGADTLAKEAQAGLQMRYSMHGLPVELRIGVTAENHIREYWLLEQVKSGLKLMEAHGEEVELADKDVSDDMNGLSAPHSWIYLLSTREVSCLMAIPYGEDDIPGTRPVHPVILRTPLVMQPATQGFAVTNDPSRPIAFGISPEDSLRHTLLLGPTGVGKSTAMLNMILNDIDAGLGVIVIDPKGDLNMDILARMDLSRADDVVCIDPTENRIVGINPLRSTSDSDVVADGLLAVLRSIFISSWGQRIEDTVANALMTLTRLEGVASLVMLPRLLQDKAFRDEKLGDVIAQDPIGIGSFWRQYEELPESRRQDMIAPIMSKLRTIMTRKPLLRTLGQEGANFDLEELYTKRKIVLVSLNKSTIGVTSAQLLGSIILSQVWTLAQAQSVLPENERPIVKVYVDEMQDYLALPISISDALSQARGYHVGFVLAHQYRDQVKDRELLSGIDANIAHKVVFGLNDPDARVIALMSGVLRADDFKNLPRHNVYIQTLCEGQKVWLSAQTKTAPLAMNDANLFKRYSLQNYGKRIERIDKEMSEIYGI